MWRFLKLDRDRRRGNFVQAARIAVYYVLLRALFSLIARWLDFSPTAAEVFGIIPNALVVFYLFYSDLVLYDLFKE
jgi:hypothetical protein